ncbi:hypothetical protein, partial [Treponema sp. R8-4-B8]
MKYPLKLNYKKTRSHWHSNLYAKIDKCISHILRVPPPPPNASFKNLFIWHLLPVQFQRIITKNSFQKEMYLYKNDQNVFTTIYK